MSNINKNILHLDVYTYINIILNFKFDGVVQNNSESSSDKN